MEDERKSLSSIMQKFQYKANFQELKFLNKGQSYGRLSFNTLLYLNIISSAENITASLIASQIGVSKAAVTIRINELVEKGLVIRKQSEKDKRVNYLYLSEKIKSEYDDYDNAYEGFMGKIEADFTDEEIKIFSRVMDRLSDWE